MPGWENFYYLLGSAASGLIGLLFVVVTLNAGRDRESSLRGAGIYMTPTVLNFAVVLAISAVSLAPGLPLWVKGAAFAVAAVFGLGVALRSVLAIALPRAGSGPPHWSDLWCYGVAPFAIHLALVFVIVAAVWASANWSPYAMGALLLALLLLGVRNAWDLVTWIAPARGSARAPADPPA